MHKLMWVKERKREREKERRERERAQNAAVGEASEPIAERVYELLAT